MTANGTRTTTVIDQIIGREILDIQGAVTIKGFSPESDRWGTVVGSYPRILLIRADLYIQLLRATPISRTDHPFVTAAASPAERLLPARSRSRNSAARGCRSSR